MPPASAAKDRFRFGLGFVKLGFVFGFFINFVRRRDIHFFGGNRSPGKGHGIGW